MSRNIFYVITQYTTVNKEVFENNADEYFTEVNEVKIPGTSRVYTQKIYHPFNKEPWSLMFANANNVKSGIVPIKEILLGVDTIEMDDNKI